MPAGVPIGYDSRADFGNGITSASKISVAAVVAQNNDNLKKLISSEVTKVGFSGKTASTLKSDVNVNASLYELDNPLTSDDESEVPKFIENNLSTTLTEEVVNSESFASTFPTYDENSDGLFVVGTQSDANVNASLYELDNSSTSDDESEIPSFTEDQAFRKSLLDEEKQKIAQSSATADGPFDKSLPPGGRDLTHTDAYLENEKVATAALNNEANELMIAKHNVTHGTNYLQPVVVDVSDINSGTTYRSMHTDMDELKASERFVDGGSESYYFETQDDDGNDISVLIENESEEKLYGVDAENLFLQNSKDGLITPQREGLGFTSDDITTRAIAEAKVLALKERETMTAAEIDLISESISEKSRRLVKEEAETYKGRGNGQAELDEIAKQQELKRLKNIKPAGDKTHIREKFEAQRIAQEKLIAAEKAKAKKAESLENQKKILDRQDLENTDDGIASGERAAQGVERLKQAEIRRKKQQAILDRQGEERTGGDKEGQVYRKLKAEKTAAAKLKKDLEVADRIGGKQDRDNDRSNDPLFLLAGDPYAFSNLSYPYNVTNSNENGHYILFYVNVQNKTKYLYNTPQVGVTVGDYIEKPGYFPGDDTNIAPSARGSNKFVNSGEASREGGADAGPISYQSQTIKNGGKGNILRNNMKFLQKSRKAPYAGINSRYPTTTRITDSVALYLPTGIGNTTTASYGDSQTGVAGYLALSGVDILQDVKDLDFAGATDKLFGVGGTLITEAIKKIGIGAIQGLTDTEGLTQSFDKIFGQTLNPYIEVTYTSFGMRTFDYTFKFAPESARESDEVKAIIQLFRFHMAPEMKGDAHRYLTLPSTFDIHYMFQSGMGDEAVAKENSFYNKIATCVLTSVDVNYTPNEGVKSFADGAPTQLSMALSFQETEMLTKQKINDGF